MKRVAYIWLASAMGLLFACRSEKMESSIPDNILGMEEISDILFEFSLAESAANLNIKNVAQNKLDSAYAFNPLKSHHIRPSQFDSSITFYCRHSELYKKVYEIVLNKLQEFETHPPQSKDTIKSK